MNRFGTVGLLALFATGCPYVTKNDYECKLACLDEDGDGSRFLQDCDDHDPSRKSLPSVGPSDPKCAPCEGLEITDAFAELDDAATWAYDGKDNDCDDQQQDLVDVDGDGFPGITFADWEAIQAAPAEGTNAANEWQQGVNKEYTLPDKSVVAAFDCDDDPSDDATGLPGAASINQAAADAPYDGIDADCHGNYGINGLDEDFDKDGDGYVASAHEDAYAALGGSLPGGDCDDGDVDVNPAVDEADDLFYDGVDSDCAGNNDFDVDGDGYMPDAYGSDDKFLLTTELGLDSTLADELTKLTQAQWESRFRDYKSKYSYTFDIEEWGDCRDVLAPSYSSLGPDEISPAETEVWYDGVDGNCNGDNDFDSDADGYMPDGAQTGSGFGGRSFVEYEAEWDYAFATELYDDCDDVDDEIHPGVLERLGDAVDQDCDGDNHTGLLRTAGYTWTEPHDLVVGATNYSYVLITAADETVRGASTNTDQGLAFQFDLAPAPEDPAYFDAQLDPTDAIVWNGSASSAYPQGFGVDGYFTSEAFYASTTYLNGTKLYHVLREVQWDTTLGLYKSPSLAYASWDDASPTTHVDVDVRVDPDGYYWSMSCGADVAEFIVAAPCTSGTKTTWSRRGSYSTLDLASPPTLTAIDSCFLIPPAKGARTATGVACSAAGACTGLTLTRADLTSATSCTVGGELIASGATTITGASRADSNGDWVVLPSPSKGVKVQNNTGTTSYTYLTTYNVYDADFVVFNTRAYLVAVVNDQTGDGKKDLLFGYSNASSPSTLASTTIVPMSDEITTWSASKVALHVDDDRVMVGALSANGDSRNGDMVGWFFMKTP